MFTKLTAILFLLIVLICGCANESDPATKPIRFQQKDGGVDCMGKFGDHLSDYANGKKSAADVTAFWGCVGKAVHDYKKLTNGELNGDYTPEGVRRFLMKYLISSEHQIDDAFLVSLMEIKRVFVGGTVARITQNELTELQNFIALLGEVTVDMNPHARVIFLKEGLATDPEVEAAAVVVEKSINRLGQWLNVKSQPYRYDQLRAFIAGLNRFQGKGSKKLQDIKTAVDMLPPLKQILLQGSRTGIAGTEWARVFSLIGRAYYSLVAVKFGFRDNLNAALARPSVPRAADLLVTVLQEAALAHPRREIPLLEFRELFEQVEKSKILDGATADGLMGVLDWVQRRLILLDETQRPTAVTADHMQVLRNRLKDWATLRDAVRADSATPVSLSEGFEEVVAASSPLEWDVHGRMLFAHQPAKTWTPSARLHMVWPYVILNWVRDAYIKNADTLGEAEVNKIAGEVLPMLQKFGWLKDTELSIGMRILQEADLFVLGANGDRLLSLSEAVRYLAFIGSSYQSGRMWLDATDEAAKSDSSCKDRNAACARRLAGDLRRNLFSHMPLFQDWLRPDSASRLRKFTITNEITALGEAQEEFTTGDLLQVMMVFHYVETFVRRFDADQSTLINYQEAPAAFDIFQLTLGKLLAKVGVPEPELYEFFTFMVKFGNTPFTMTGGQVAYDWWRWNENHRTLESDRQKLAGILAQLAKLK